MSTPRAIRRRRALPSVTVPDFKIPSAPHFIERINNACCANCMDHKYALLHAYSGAYVIHTEVILKPGQRLSSSLHVWRSRREDPICLHAWKIIRPVPGWKDLSEDELLAQAEKYTLKLKEPPAKKKLSFHSNSVIQFTPQTATMSIDTTPPWAMPPLETMPQSELNIEGDE